MYDDKGSSKIVVIFTSVRWEGRGQRLAYCFLKMSFKVFCDFEKGSQNQHFQITLLVGRDGVTKRVLCVRS